MVNRRLGSCGVAVSRMTAGPGHSGQGRRQPWQLRDNVAEHRTIGHQDRNDRSKITPGRSASRKGNGGLTHRRRLDHRVADQVLAQLDHRPVLVRSEAVL